MPIIQFKNAPKEEGYPRVERAVLVDSAQGSKSLWVAQLTIPPGASVHAHLHPNTEEAMIIVQVSLEAILGNQVVTLGPGDTVLAPAGIKHGFINRSSATALLLAAFPTTRIERVPAD